MEVKIGLTNEEMNLVQGGLAIMVQAMSSAAKAHWASDAPQSAEYCEGRVARIEQLLYKLRNESKMEENR